LQLPLKSVDLIYGLVENEYNGFVTTQLMVHDIKPNLLSD